MRCDEKVPKGQDWDTAAIFKMENKRCAYPWEDLGPPTVLRSLTSMGVTPFLCSVTVNTMG